MTIQEARKILGKDSEKLTDNQISEYINSASVLSDIFFDTYIKGRLKKEKNKMSK